MTDELDRAALELEAAARELRAPDVDRDRAAALIERCAEIAGRINKELERAAREADRDLPGDGQEQLL